MQTARHHRLLRAVQLKFSFSLDMRQICFPVLALFTSAIFMLGCARKPEQASVSELTKRPERIQSQANFGAEPVSAEARKVADWIAVSQDNAGAAFIIIDKKQSTAYVFTGNAHLRVASPVLLGAAIGDDAAPGIGSKPLEQVLPHERTTHAGRFVAELGHNARGEDVVWIDYDAALSMHRVLTNNPAERRLDRLTSPTIEDNRISNGCINVPVAFYENHLLPLFRNQQRAIVYVLPELKSTRQVFGL